MSMKACTKCGEEKALGEFPRSGKYADGSPRYRAYCKACTREYAARWYAENRDRKREYAARWRAENPDRAREYVARWYAKNRDRRLGSVARWRTKNPDRTREYTARRRARKAAVEHVPYDRAEIVARWGGTCCYCDAPAEHLDHVVPLSRGGADAAHNLVPACAACNCSKGAKSLAEWAETFRADSEHPGPPGAATKVEASYGLLRPRATTGEHMIRLELRDGYTAEIRQTMTADYDVRVRDARGETVAILAYDEHGVALLRDVVRVTQQ